MAEPEYEGDLRHPQHFDYLRQLGVAVFAAAGVAGIVVDILRIHHNVSYFTLVDQTLGSLVNILREHADQGSPIPDLRGYVAEVDRVRVIRNDLIHALPVLHGLHRRTGKDLGRVVNFYSVAALHAITADFDQVRGRGNRLLYYDGGEALRAWYARGGS